MTGQFARPKRVTSEGSPSARDDPGTGQPAKAPPLLSVLVFAYQRREFLREALESVLSQRLPRESFEVWAITSWDDPPLRAELERRGISMVSDPRRELGAWIADLLPRLQGDVLVLLDDDDRFLPGKLEAVYATFSRDPQIGYFRNGMERSDRRPQGGRIISERPVRFTSGPKDHRLAIRVWWAGGSFNSSTVAVRRSIVEPVTEYLREVAGGPSTFLYFAALLSPLDLLVVPDRLTWFRAHPGSYSGWSEPDPIVRWARAAARAPEILRETEALLRMLRDRGCDRTLEGPPRIVDAQFRLLRAAFAVERSRRKVLVAWVHLVRTAVPRRPLAILPYVRVLLIGLTRPARESAAPQR
jgi:hypothetical protein